MELGARADRSTGPRAHIQQGNESTEPRSSQFHLGCSSQNSHTTERKLLMMTPVAFSAPCCHMKLLELHWKWQRAMCIGARPAQPLSLLSGGVPTTAHGSKELKQAATTAHGSKELEQAAGSTLWGSRLKVHSSGQVLRATHEAQGAPLDGGGPAWPHFFPTHAAPGSGWSHGGDCAPWDGHVMGPPSHPPHILHKPPHMPTPSPTTTPSPTPCPHPPNTSPQIPHPPTLPTSHHTHLPNPQE